MFSCFETSLSNRKSEPTPSICFGVGERLQKGELVSTLLAPEDFLEKIGHPGCGVLSNFLLFLAQHQKKAF